MRNRSSPQRVENELRDAILRSDFVVIDYREGGGLRECVCVYDRDDLKEIAQSLVVLNEFDGAYSTSSLIHLYVEGGGSPMRVTLWAYALYPGDHHDKEWEYVVKQHGWETDPSFWETLWAKMRRTLKRNGVRARKSEKRGKIHPPSRADRAAAGYRKPLTTQAPSGSSRMVNKIPGAPLTPAFRLRIAPLSPLLFPSGAPASAQADLVLVLWHSQELGLWDRIQARIYVLFWFDHPKFRL